MAPKLVMDTVKKILQSKKITYQQLAEDLGMSESGLKKLFNSSDLSMKRLNQIADLISIPMIEILQLAEEQKIKPIHFTSRQEQAFLADEMLFRVFWHLTVEERPASEVLRKESLSSEKMNRYLMKLENLDLIRRGKKDRIYKIHNGLIRWPNEGKLLKKLNTEWSRSLLDKVLNQSANPRYYHQLSYYRLSSQSCESFYADLNQIILKYARLSKREQLEYSPSELKDLTSLIALAPDGFLS